MNTITIIDCLWRRAAEIGDRPAYTYLEPNRPETTVTYERLAERVRSLAGALLSIVKPGSRAILLYSPGIAFIEAFLACLAAGIIAVPAYPPRRNRSIVRLVSMFRGSCPSIVLTDSSIKSDVESELRQLLAEMGCLCISTSEVATADTSFSRLPHRSMSDTAFLQYTSGSTGDPKGVIVSHRNIIANEQMIKECFGHSSASVSVGWLPVFHDMGLLGFILQPLFVGFHSLLMSPVTFLRDPYYWLKMITRYRATTSGGPNFAYEYCVKKVTEEQKETLDLSSWRVAFNGSEPVRARTLDEFASTFNRCGFRSDAFLPCYGLAEATLIVTGCQHEETPKRDIVDAEELAQNRVVNVEKGSPGACELVSSGWPMSETKVIVVDSETRRELPEGRVGELWISSPSVAAGYWNSPDETKHTFEASLFSSPEERYLRTGDVGYLKKGQLYVSGRSKDLIIIRGRNVYPQDIEQIAERSFPWIAANACAAFGITVNDEEKVALVVEGHYAMLRSPPKASDTESDGSVSREQYLYQKWGPTTRDLRQAISRQMDIQVYLIAFVRPGTFPRTSSGKVQRRECRERLVNETLEIMYLDRVAL